MKRLLTIGVLAEQLDCSLAKVVYLLKSRNIKPVSRAGQFRIYSSGVVNILRREIEEIERRKQSRSCQKAQSRIA